MRINGHAHIFNLHTVLTTEAVEIMVGRLERNGYPDFIVNGVRKLLLAQLKRPEYLTEEGLLRRFMAAISDNEQFRAFLAAEEAQLPFDVKLLGSDTAPLAAESLRAALDHLSTHLDPRDGLGRGIFDLFETLRLAMHSDIVGVADALLGQLPDDTGLVALMMDIVASPEPPSDHHNFLAQMRGTSDAALMRPGRIFPFIAVNPNRPEHFAVMQQAIEQMGFVGVKLYPSLGYRVDTAAMDAVLQYCDDEDVPIVVHTTAGGFFKNPETAEFSNPRAWLSLLAARPKLRVSFAHCGGWGGLCNQDASQVPWWNDVLAMIKARENVYGDLSYHVEMRSDPAKETAYFGALKALLADPVTAERIIFGTDSWLVRMSIAEEPYWRYFMDHLDADELRKIMEVAPARFLGLPVNGSAPRKNIQRHIAWLEARATLVGDAPTSWVTSLTDVQFTPVRVNPHWSLNNRAHVFLYKFLRYEVKQIPKDLVAIGFEGAGKVRLRQLGYFTKDHEPAAMFENRCRENAVNLDLFLRNNGAAYEGDYTRQSAVDGVRMVFADGDRTLAEAAASIDAIYLFSTEV